MACIRYFSSHKALAHVASDEIPSNPSAPILKNMVYNDSADIMSAVVGVYLNFKVSGGGNNIFGGMMTHYIGCASDELSMFPVITFLTNTYLAQMQRKPVLGYRLPKYLLYQRLP